MAEVQVESDPLDELLVESEYILVSDKTSEVLKSALGWNNAAELRKLASVIRKAGGECTIFKATKY
jgi:hypothetical protein